MKVIRLMFIFGMFCLSTTLFAQGPGQGRPGGRGGQMNMDTLQAKLSLSDDQVEEFKAINIQMREKRRELFEASDGDRESMRESMRGLRDETNQQIKDILTLEQWNKYEEFLKQMRENRRNRPEGGERPKRRKKKSRDTDSQ